MILFCFSVACVDIFILRRHQNGMKTKIIKSVIWMVRVSVIGQKLQPTWWEVQVQSNSRVNNYVINYSVLKNVHFHIHTYITNDSFHTILVYLSGCLPTLFPVCYSTLGIIMPQSIHLVTVVLIPLLHTQWGKVSIIVHWASETTGFGPTVSLEIVTRGEKKTPNYLKG